MSYEILPAFEVDSPEWHEARRTSLGASEIAAVLGLSPWQSPLSVYMAKMGVRNQIPEDLAYFGRALEEPIAQWIKDKRPEVPPLKPGFSARNAEYPWLSASPDRVADDAGLLLPIELKTSSAFSRDSWADGVPDYYAVQVQTQLLVLGAPYGWLAVLHGGNDPELYRIEADPIVQEQIVRITGEFWRDHVLAEVPPEPTTTAEAVELWPGDPEVTVEGDERLYELWGTYGLMQAEAVELGRQLDSIKLELQKAMQDAVALTYQGRELFTWRPRAGSRRLDAKALQADHPDIFATYYKAGEPTRVFTRKTTKDVES